MRTSKRTRYLLVTISSAALFMGLGWAQDQDQQNQQDPPARVGRVAMLQGPVSYRASTNTDWADASGNYPVAAGNSFWTQPGSKADIQIGEAYIRMDGGTELDVVQLDDQNVIFAISQGRADVSLAGRQPNERVDAETPRGDADLVNDGTYRIFAGTTQDPTRFAAFVGGQAQFEGTDQPTIGNGLEATAGVTTPISYNVTAAQEDAFDQWAIQRQEALEAHPMPSYVPQVPGVAELQQYGDWQDQPQYGHVWFPNNVPADWAPYRYGHWAYVQPWGYTWVDDQTWGFAPFHYGRWVQVSGRWGWVAVDPGAPPPPPNYRPVYAPALVSFVGNPGALTVGVSIGGVAASVGWFPLGPGEPFVPWYPHSVGYVRNVNYINVNRTVINNITTINNRVVNINYVNQRAVTVVPQAAMLRGQPVNRVAIRVAPAAFNRPIQVAAPGVVQRRVLPPPPARPVPPPGGALRVAVPPRAALRMAAPLPRTAAAAAIRQPAVRTNSAERAPVPPREANRPGAVPEFNRPGAPPPANRPAEAARPGAPAPANRPAEAARPAFNRAPEATRPGGPPEANRPEAPRPGEAARTTTPETSRSVAPSANRPSETRREEANRPAAAPEANRAAARPEVANRPRPEAAAHPEESRPAPRPEENRSAAHPPSAPKQAQKPAEKQETHSQPAKPGEQKKKNPNEPNNPG